MFNLETLYSYIFWTNVAGILIIFPLIYSILGTRSKYKNVMILFAGMFLIIIGLYFKFSIIHSGIKSDWLDATKSIIDLSYILVGSALVVFAFNKQIQDSEK